MHSSRRGLDLKIYRSIFRENYLRAAKFLRPDFTPCRVVLTRAMFYIYREKLVEIIKKYPLAFPDHNLDEIKLDKTPRDLYEDRYVRDVFGTLWRYRIAGLGPQPHQYPLEDLDRVKDWSLPDPEEGYPLGYADPKPMISWEELFNYFDKLKEQGRIVGFSLHHFLFQKLMDVVPLNKLTLAIYREDEKFLIALKKIADYQYGLLKIAKKYSKGIDVVLFLEDLGSQTSPLIRIEHLRRYFLPYYKKFFEEVKSMNSLVYFHSDGMIAPLFDTILEAEPDILNIQDLNGVENISVKLKGRICIDLDIDRQKLIPYGSREDIYRHIQNVVEKLNTENGGLMIHIEVYPPTPLENIEYLAQSCYKYCLKIEQSST